MHVHVWYVEWHSTEKLVDYGNLRTTVDYLTCDYSEVGISVSV